MTSSSEIVHSARARLGPVGVWLGVLGRAPIDEERRAARRIEALGYGSIWTPEGIGGKEAFAHQLVLLAATRRIATGTGIANVWARHPATMQGGAATLGAAYPGRFVLGVGISHAPAVERSGQEYVKPLQHMARYLDGMDAAVDAAPATEMPVPRVLAALRPRMLALARDRADGAHPYFVPVSHTPIAREALGPDKLLIPEQAVVVNTDPDDARRIARDHMRGYLQLPNYVNNLRYLGYTDEDFSGGGSDRLVDAIVAWGDAADVARRVRAHLAGGADHVLLQPLGDLDEALRQLERYRAATVERTDGLVTTLHELLLAHQEEGTISERFSAMDALIAPRSEELLEACEAHLAHAGSNFFPFMWRAYKSHRATLFGLLDALQLRSTSQDSTLEEALRFLQSHSGRTGEWLRTTRTERAGPRHNYEIPLLDLSWVPDGWWRLLTDESRRDRFPGRVHRRHFEACVFSQLMWELKAGDLCIVGSDAFADYREQLVSWETYQERVADYGATAGLPVDGPAFVGQVRDWLDGIAQATDEAFPDNKLVRIENDEPIITRPPKRPESAGVRDLEARLAEHMPEENILDMLTDTEHWLHWTSRGTRSSSPSSARPARRRRERRHSRGVRRRAARALGGARQSASDAYVARTGALASRSTSGPSATPAPGVKRL